MWICKHIHKFKKYLRIWKKKMFMNSNNIREFGGKLRICKMFVNLKKTNLKNVPKFKNILNIKMFMNLKMKKGKKL